MRKKKEKEGKKIECWSAEREFGQRGKKDREAEKKERKLKGPIQKKIRPMR